MKSNIELCKKIQLNITKLSSGEIDEIFKILYKNNSTYTKNNNGIFVNLNWLNESILEEINNYINFCLTSQSEITKYELMKNLLNDSMINKEKIDYNMPIIANTSNIEINNNISINKRVSSSMKFYLLKKNI